MSLAFTPIEGRYAIVRLPADDAIPSWAHGAFVSITRTSDELSIVCNEGNVPDVTADRGWRCLKLMGPLPLDQTGVAAAFTRVLADAGIALFVVATYDTDYVLVRDAALEHASLALRTAGYTVR
ncbi:MAG: ACT domain-containing protein [Thermoanaerobaculia bacterium]